MADDRGEEANVSVSVPVSLIAASVAIVAGAAAAYMLANRGDEEGTPGATAQKRKPGRSFGRKLGLRAVIALLENDNSRKVVIAILKSMAKRS